MNDGTCARCHGTGKLHRQDCGCQGITLPCPDCLIDDYDDFETGDCWNCGGEGFTYGCGWDWQCDTYDEGEGTCLCTNCCEWCNPPQLTPEEEAKSEALRTLMAKALNPEQDNQHD